MSGREERIGVDVERGIDPTQAHRGCNCRWVSLATCQPCTHPSPDFPFVLFSRFAYRQAPCRTSRRRVALLSFFHTHTPPLGLFSKSMPSEPLSPPITSDDSQNNSRGIIPRLSVLILIRIRLRTLFAFKIFSRLHSAGRFDSLLDHTVYPNKFKYPHQCTHALGESEGS